MTLSSPSKWGPVSAIAAAIAAVFVYLWALLHAESQFAVGGLLLLALASTWGLRRVGWAASLGAASNASPRVLGVGCIVGPDCFLPFSLLLHRCK